MSVRWFPALALAFVACSQPADTTDDDTDATDYPLPTVRISSPTNGATVVGTTATITLEITDFVLIEAETAALRRHRGIGPLPVWPVGSALWNAWMPQSIAHTPGDEPGGYISVTLDGDEVQQATTVPITLEGLTLGSHDLGVELRYPDGDGFFPAVSDEITVTFVAP